MFSNIGGRTIFAQNRFSFATTVSEITRSKYIINKSERNVYIFGIVNRKIK